MRPFKWALASVSKLCAGGLSRAIATAALCPITLIKTRMEATGAHMLTGRNNMFTVARDVVRAWGVRGLWRGCVPTVLANAPFSAIYYSVYMGIRQHAAPAGWPQAATNFAAGVAAAMVATLATQPSDVLRSRAMLLSDKSSTLAWASSALGGDGRRIFLAGASPRFVKRTLQTALVWTLYESALPTVSRALAGTAPAA